MSADKGAMMHTTRHYRCPCCSTYPHGNRTQERREALSYEEKAERK